MNSKYKIIKFRENKFENIDDFISIEEPLEISIRYKEHDKWIKNSLKRPIAVNSSELELLELINKRSDIYSKALYKIECDGLTKNQIVNHVLKIYEN